MPKLAFNRNSLVLGNKIDQPTPDLVKNTMSLWNASLEDAARYGGDLTRAALSAMKFRHEHRYIVVDTKVHMLMPGMNPAIPGWHTDGAPRGPRYRPDGDGPPDVWAQQDAALGLRSPRYHLLVTGNCCLTEFMPNPVELEIDKTPSVTLYANVTEQVNRLKFHQFVAPTCQVVEFDWWDLHRGVEAWGKEWRFLIRVTETDHLQPQTDLRKILRTQQNVYLNGDKYGW